MTTAAGTDITTYTYDAADRLTSESTSLAAGGTSTTTYQWDGNGNLQAKIEPSQTTLYRFDPQNRLVDIRTGATQAQASAAVPMVSYAYDANGNRIKKTTVSGTSNYVIDSTYEYAQVANESGTSYVRGNQLVRQTKGAGASGDDLFPLQGHLGTSVGALDADGNLIEQIDSDAFGKFDQPTGCKLTHIYTGEYWDQDSQLLYLRARWYDPRMGRFVSADPFEGRQYDSRSLNRYVYAQSSPLNGTDPSGAMTLGEVGSAMDTALTLATRAYNAYDFVNSLIAPDMDHDSDNANEKPTIWDSMMALAVSAVDPSSFGTAAASIMSAVGGTEEHHAIPVYMCGARNQRPLVRLPHADHVVIHWLLNATTVSVTVLGNSLEYALSKRNVSKTRPIMKYIARTPMGRAAILGTLAKFYDGTGYLHHGVGGDTIEAALKRYGPLFVASRANTSWSTNCMR